MSNASFDRRFSRNIGTAHFVSRTHAMLYYARTAECKLTNIDDVQGKIDRGEIHIGEPDVSSRNVVDCYTDNDGRYHLVVIG